jgi:DNA-binding XRE family transcriptional regulator
MALTEKELKEMLFDHCLKYAQDRLSTIRSAMSYAVESANDDSKSSAGDKHETGRSMAQLEQEKLSGQLLEAEKLIQTLNQIERGKISPNASLGSLFITTNGNYYLSVSAGKLLINNITYFAVSPLSPIGVVLMQQKINSAFIFNGKEFSIEKIL